MASPCGVAIVIGAGPAGLTAAHELLTRTRLRPVVLEAAPCVGGLSRAVVHNGNRMDIGGHRFFSKSDRVMQWWLERLPLDAAAPESARIAYHGQARDVSPRPDARPAAGSTDVMLLRPRRSRIYYRRRFFDYPLSLGLDTLRKLGPWQTARILASYARAVLRPIRPERTLEDFFINRFGRELYATFFRSYTEKVWGVPCDRISAAWGAQRVKGLSIRKALLHVLRRAAGRAGASAAKNGETSLIEQFLYPCLGPGQMWEKVAAQVRDRGGEIHLNQRVIGVHRDGPRVTAVEAVGPSSGERRRYAGDVFFSTMPIQDLFRALDPPPPADVLAVSDGLVYRDFITVGLLVDRLRLSEDGTPGALIRDNWIYIQEPDVRLGRLQVFNNWSPHLVADPGRVWLGLEYFCNEGDELWRLSDVEMIALAADELCRIGILEPNRVRDAVVVREPKTYPAYFGTYDRFDVIRAFADSLENLLLIGRNGMHRYNNQDHSMLTAMTAVDNLVAGRADKSNIWDVNTEEDYHEERRP
ncbi:MAG: NAD(P)/FAD-dependent oxidoreductase [Phycisphaerales bacterium]|nr:NAD(P)/FAD-dependent oxidoreductase [Phycisphaerales bacterium]